MPSPFLLGKNIDGELVYGVDVLNDKTAKVLTDGGPGCLK